MKRELGREVTDGIPLVPVKVRELAPGVSWIIGCIAVGHGDTLIHSHASAYLLTGEHHSALIDTGYPRHWPELDTILDELLGDRGLDYIIPTHPEIPHAGLVRQLIDKYPDSVVAGDVRDYHAYFGIPEERLRAVPEGEVLDLGGLRLEVADAVILDLPATVWLFEHTTRTLFVADAFAYAHKHADGECHLLSSELPDQPTAEQIGFVTSRALYWTMFAELEPLFARLDASLEHFDPAVIAPAHGSVIDDPAAILPHIKAGMREVSRL
ncbi:MAG TPA: MBL fold metallo-hydrolase [Pseudolysinimonas sp.]|nr:MBL fold metallo-hydrolase [Pseudolysinimonas sp.]